MAWTTKLDDGGNIHVRFDGYLDEAGGVESAAEVVRLLEERPRELILEVQAMRGYQRGARLAWQKALWDRRSLISRMVLLGGNSVVRMGGSVMAMFLGVPIVVREAQPLVEGDAAAPRPRAASRPSSRAHGRPARERSWAAAPIRRIREESHAL